ncbi:hypothetical protein FOA52_010149 [Chlamydomonas sp. UWO 241]|nr:hypothetical protein FOA52_010252 [Chlamydomonas sp. UWO 241]KAG1655083.1 hypothetical protein FOA52_004223 [Chlamydomonas sp. UWO 241]KAG1670413.1 hypothetical protein FOA52_010148 [Chlamydomonas sp. UWO 241]KAG1670414.1 hypothetical protein FOA52_010149 [Chlamydomonas sp. UWO 241]
MAVPGCKRGLLPMAGVAPRQIALKRCKYADAADVAVARTSMDGGADTSDYECSVCLSLLVDPVVGQCGHDFCKSCLDEWRASFSPRGCVSCPICRQPAMAPGVTSLGICVRIQKQIQAHFPEQLEARRQELEVAAAEREAQRARQIEGQVASVQQLMRARFHAISGVLRSSVPVSTSAQASPFSAQQQQQQQPVAAPASAAQATVWAMSARPAPVPAPSSLGRAVSAPTSPSHASPDDSFSPTTSTFMLRLYPAPVASTSLPSTTSNEASTMPQASAPSTATPTWQAPESDIALRQSTAEQLVHVLHRLRPDMETTFRHRLPNLVRKLEEGLYCTAGSREAYADVTTLEARLQNLVRRLTVPRQQL